jgi:hypothetical protein
VVAVCNGDGALSHEPERLLLAASSDEDFGPWLALDEHERGRLSQSTADIRLVAGEFAVNEGDDADR